MTDSTPATAAAYRPPWSDIEKRMTAISRQDVVEALREITTGLLEINRCSWAISVGQAIAVLTEEGGPSSPARDLYLEVADKMLPALREPLARALEEQGL